METLKENIHFNLIEFDELDNGMEWMDKLKNGMEWMDGMEGMEGMEGNIAVALETLAIIAYKQPVNKVQNLGA